MSDLTPLIKSLALVKTPCPECPGTGQPRYNCGKACPVCEGTKNIPKYPLTEPCPGEIYPDFGEDDDLFLQTEHETCGCNGSGTRPVSEELAAIRLLEAQPGPRPPTRLTRRDSLWWVLVDNTKVSGNTATEAILRAAAELEGITVA